MVNNLINASRDRSFYYTPTKNTLVYLDKYDRNFNLFKDTPLYKKGEVFTTYFKINNKEDKLSSYNKAQEYKEEKIEPLDYTARIIR